jgi:SanA protein
MKRAIAIAVALPVLAVALAVVFASWADRHVGQAAAGRMFDTLDEIPKRDVALVLGTSKYSNGRINPFYTARIRAAAELYHAGKVDGLLVSGDNGRADYNEPAQMAADLAALGVPAEYITADYAGFRTLDSIYRAGDVFGLQSYTIVSQDFHVERALYLAAQKGHDAIGYLAYSPRGFWGRHVRNREILARAQAVLDVEVLNKGPRFLGEPITVNARQDTQSIDKSSFPRVPDARSRGFSRVERSKSS